MTVPTGILKRGTGYLDLAYQARTAAKASDPQVRENARLHLVERMGRLRGLPQKMGQMLSLSDDADQARAFAPLTDAAQPLPFDEIQPILERAWQAPLDSVVADIQRQGLAASLGQVHRATLLDGQVVAVKARYPGIRQAVLTDLKAIGWLSVPVGDLRRGFDLNQYRAEITRNLDEELDYRLEAQHQKIYGQYLSDEPGWIVPNIVTHLSTEDVLVSQWVEGEHIDAAAEWPEADRAKLARALIRGFCRMLFRYGQIHADPHPGNYRFTRTASGPAVVLYDFGSVATLEPQHRLALMKLIQMTASQRGDPYPLFIAMGFDERLLASLRHKLAAVCTVLFEPFGQPSKFNLDRWQCSERLTDVLGDDRWNFRMAGPAHLLLILRAFRGLTFYLNRLKQDVSWHHALRPYLAEHESALAAMELPPTDNSPSDLSNLAKYLRILVTQNGSTKVSLTFPAAAVEDMADLMDDALACRIRDQGIDLQAIIQRARASAYRPQELFALDEQPDSKGVRTWLE